jgi:hypothetical protein
MPFGLICVATLAGARAVSPGRDGGYPGGNTAEERNALVHLPTGTFNIASGLFSLESLTEGKLKTGVSANTLLSNRADQKTPIGFGALFRNTTCFSNTANGVFALFSNTASFNTASGAGALQSNTSGTNNIAIGIDASLATNGNDNTAIGTRALFSSTGDANTGRFQITVTKTRLVEYFAKNEQPDVGNLRFMRRG